MRAQLDHPGLPLVGRSRELAAIGLALESATTGSGGLLCIVGEPGIGKTRLAQEAVSMARSLGFICAWGSGWSEGGSPPLWPWPDIVEQLGEDADPVAAGPGSDLAGRTVDAEARRFAQFRSVARAIGRASRISPVLIVIDNAHAADAGALLLARFAVRALPTARVVFVITAQYSAAERDDCRATLAGFGRDGVVLRPQAWNVDTVREVLAEVGQPASVRRAEDVHRLTGGNPLLLHELVASASCDGGAGPVRAILELRTQHLGPVEREVLRLVALLGPLAQAPLIAAAAALDPERADHALGAGSSAGVLVRTDSGSFRFSHDLLAEAELASCTDSELAELHGRVALALEPSGVTGSERAVAAGHHHLARARLRPDGASLAAAQRSCSRAAESLVQHLAYEAAARLLAEFVELSDRSGVPVNPDLVLSLARAELSAGNLRAARPWFRRAANQADSPALLADAALGLGGIWVDEHRNAMEHAAYMTLVERAIEGLGDDHPHLRARLVVRRAAEQAYTGSGSLGAVRDAVSAARSVGDALVLAESLSLLHHILLGPRSAADRLAVADELVTCANVAGDEVLAVMGALWRTVDLILAGHPGANRSLNALRERADALQIHAVLFVVAAIDVMRLLRKGLVVEAELAAQQCFDLGSSIGDADAIGYYGAHLMVIRWLQAQPEDILPLAREVANSPTLVEGDITYAVAVAALAAMAGESDEAASRLHQMLASPALGAVDTSSNWKVWMFCAVEAAHRLGDAPAARQVYALLLPFRDQPIIGSLGVACFGSSERTLGLAAQTFGDLDLAIEHFERALEATRVLGNDAVAAITSGELGCALIQRGIGNDAAEGHVLIQSAISALDTMGLPRRVAALQAFAGKHIAEPMGELEHFDGAWRMSTGDTSVTVADSIGMQRLVQLLERPFVDVSVAQLVGGFELTSRHEMIDATALRQYRDQVAELRSELDEAEDHNDIVRAERLREQLDTLLEHLAAGAGLGRRSRQFTTPTERARVAVRKSLSRVFDEIACQAPTLGAQVAGCIHTGLICRFQPQDGFPAIWKRTNR